MEKTKIHPQQLMDVIASYWNAAQPSLESIKSGIETHNFSLVYESSLMAKGYLDVASGYAYKALNDILEVTEDAECGTPTPEEPFIVEDISDAEIVAVPTQVVEE